MREETDWWATSRKLLNDMKVEEAMEFMQDRMKRTKTNEEFLDTMSQ